MQCWSFVYIDHLRTLIEMHGNIISNIYNSRDLDLLDLVEKGHTTGKAVPWSCCADIATSTACLI